MNELCFLLRSPEESSSLDAPTNLLSEHTVGEPWRNSNLRPNRLKVYFGYSAQYATVFAGAHFLTKSAYVSIAPSTPLLCSLDRLPHH